MRSHKGESTVMPKSGMPLISGSLKINSLIYKEYRQDIVSKLDRIAKLRDKFAYVINQANELYIIPPQFTDIQLKLDEIYQTVTLLAYEQVEPTFPYLFDRQARLSKISNDLYDLQEKVSEEDKRISTHKAECETPFFKDSNLQLQSYLKDDTPYIVYPTENYFETYSSM